MSKQPLITALALLSLIASAPIWAAAENQGLALGDTVPNIHANDHNGELWRLKDHVGKGNYLVLYFYPAAMTGGCTQQACAYRDDAAILKKRGIEVVGISSDAVKNLQAFRQAENLTFPLLSDINGAMAKLFGVPLQQGGTIQRTVDGKELDLVRSFTPARWTFIIDRQGKLIHRNKNVNTANDSQAAIDFIQALP